ncbi:hypothetical protein [Labrys sp. ZIDIC5]|uniref:hypothetical protein n=1 Tax=Labrys sedimenti TaxID=3106036 RepID=UPI002ACAC27B|nr:hypothetical protein [Labrys sp. ZIDIC5]MDZ5454480.1 hypothetical protein [Labrys sp. ZIDIC5]
MGETKKKIYAALVAGAASGLHSAPLYAYVANKVPKSDNERVIRAAFQALRDPRMTDPASLRAICSLAVERRLIDLGISTESGRGRRKKNLLHPA